MLFAKASPAEREPLRLACEQDLLTFTALMFRARMAQPFLVNWHHARIVDALMAVYRGEIHNLLITMPPGGTKTELAVIHFMAWWFARSPHCRFLHLSGAAELAALNSATVKEIIELDEFQSLWPRRIRPDTRAKSRWNIDVGGRTAGGVYATSTGGQVTGWNLVARRFGLGVGLSQRGAQQMANEGFSYDQILEFYYPGLTRTRYTMTRTLLSSMDGTPAAPSTPDEPIADAKPAVVTLLKVQYRMNEQIMRFSSDWFYGGEVQTAPGIERRSILDYDRPMMWVDTSEAEGKEEFVGENFGRINRTEAELTQQPLQQYFEKIGKQRILAEHIDVGIISPYRAQVQLLHKMIRQSEFFRPYRRAISVNTVDGFQGQERDIIVISLVRNNDGKEIGFLRDLRRMNVAITRARMKLIILGSAATMTAHPF